MRTAFFMLKPDSHPVHLSTASQWRLPYSSDLTFGQHTAIVLESEEILQTGIVSLPGLLESRVF